MRVLDSTATFDELRVEDGTGYDGVSGVQFERSQGVIRNSEFARLDVVVGTTGVLAQSSRLVLDRVNFVAMDSRGSGLATGLTAENSDVLALHTLWRDSRGDAFLIYARNSRLVAVNSHWERNFGGAGAVIQVASGASALFLNCSFVENQFYYEGMIRAAGELEVINSTFWRNTTVTHGDPIDITAQGGAEIALHNSLLSSEVGAVAPHTGIGNCALDRDAPLLTIT